MAVCEAVGRCNEPKPSFVQRAGVVRHVERAFSVEACDLCIESDVTTWGSASVVQREPKSVDWATVRAADYLLELVRRNGDERGGLCDLLLP